MKDRELQDWGGYEPETQKALRFVTHLAGEGTAKQVAEAIAHEYVKCKEPESEEEPKPASTNLDTAMEAIRAKLRTKRGAIAKHKALTDEDMETIVDDWIAKHPYARIDEAQRRSMIQAQIQMRNATPGWVL